jgi:hypothetical protein
VIVPKDPASQAWNLQGNLDNSLSGPKLPEGFDEWSDEKRKEWGKSQQEAQRQWQDSRRYYAFAVAEDGSFRVEDVAPGTYRLILSVTQEGARYRDSVASAQVEVKIDEIPGGQTDEPLDMGTLELKPTKQLKVGEALPVTVLKTIDGPAVNLADYNGKYVLIHFWTSVNKQFAPELAVLKEIHEQFGKDGRLVIIGINTNSIPATGKAFAEKNGMKWVQAYAGMDYTIYQELRIREHPPHLLVGPDGKLIWNVTKIDELKEQVGKALGKAAP